MLSFVIYLRGFSVAIDWFCTFSRIKIYIPLDTIIRIPITLFNEGNSVKYNHPTSGYQNKIEYSKGETTDGEAML